ncbi:hypothetical protein [Flavobacterium sp.]|jgi:hypothetical protein|uniref:hypothetical protein n=1 Tax=Flavobacterium sp. TaxID=239 RepID=UPI0037BF6914
MANATPLGYPHAGAGTVEILLENEDGVDYTLLFSPDPHNNDLRKENKAMQFYYYPKAPRLAKEPVKDGKYKFSMQVFKGVIDSGIIGSEGFSEEAGAFTTLTSTIDVPEQVLKKAIDKLKQKLHTEYQNQRHSKLFGLFSYIKGVDKDFNETNVRPIQLTENKISMHIIGEKDKLPFDGQNPWSFNVQGEGNGTTFGLGENAFSVLMGRNSALLVKSSLENGNNNLVVQNAIKYKGYLPTTKIKTTIDVKRVHTYFSAKANVSVGGYADLKWESEYEKIKTDGGIVSEIFTDEQFSNDEKKKFEMELLTKQREFAFQLLQKEIFDKPEKQFTPASDPNASLGLFSIFTGGISVGVSLKSGTQIREVQFTDEIKFSAVTVMDSTLSGTLTPLTTKSGDAAKEDLKKYITEVRLDEDFTKVQVTASLNGGIARVDKEGIITSDSAVNQVALEVGYPDSKGKMVWKGSGRKMAIGGVPFIKTTTSGGKTIDAVFPANWNDPSMVDDKFVFDFVKNATPSNVKVRTNVMYEKDKRVKLADKVVEYDFDGTNVFIPLPITNMVDYTLSTEELFECDTIEVTLKVDKMSTQKFKFTADNFEDMIPYKVWYEANYSIKPTQYKVKYTCKGKIGTKSKKVSISTNYVAIDYFAGDVLFEIPSGTDAQNKDVEKIRASFME